MRVLFHNMLKNRLSLITKSLDLLTFYSFLAFIKQNEKQGARNKDPVFGSIPNHIICNFCKKCIRFYINGAMYYHNISVKNLL